MRIIKHHKLLRQIQEGKIEFVSEPFGTSPKYVEIMHFPSRKRETVQIEGYDKSLVRVFWS